MEKRLLIGSAILLCMQAAFGATEQEAQQLYSAITQVNKTQVKLLIISSNFTQRELEQAKIKARAVYAQHDTYGARLSESLITGFTAASIISCVQGAKEFISAYCNKYKVSESFAQDNALLQAGIARLDQSIKAKEEYLKQPYNGFSFRKVRRSLEERMERSKAESILERDKNQLWQFQQQMARVRINQEDCLSQVNIMLKSGAIMAALGCLGLCTALAIKSSKSLRDARAIADYIETAIAETTRQTVQ